jgi:hypothetical protein
MQKLAQDRRGKCLSNKYINNHTPLEWECEFGHHWNTSPNSIMSGSWCPICAGTRKHTIQEMQEIAQNRGGKCISDIYISSHSPLVWECSEEHRWESTPDSILNQNSWCSKCSKKLKYTIQEIKLIAEERGGKCISDEYINVHMQLLWECKFGHRWMIAPTYVISKNSWCPICAHHIKHTIEEMKEFAENKGGKCLSDVYINGDVKLMWQCPEGHQWMARSELILSGRWCPYCAREKRNAAKRLSIDVVKQTIEKFGYQWVSGKYINSQTKLELKCKSGHIWSVSLGNMRKRHCPKCSRTKQVRSRYRAK